MRAIVYRMARAGLSRLYVVQRASTPEVIGEVTLVDLLGARRGHLEEETRRQRPLALEQWVPRRVRVRAG